MASCRRRQNISIIKIIFLHAILQRICRKFCFQRKVFLILRIFFLCLQYLRYMLLTARNISVVFLFHVTPPAELIFHVSFYLFAGLYFYSAEFAQLVSLLCKDSLFKVPTLQGLFMLCSLSAVFPYFMLPLCRVSLFNVSSLQCFLISCYLSAGFPYLMFPLCSVSLFHATSLQGFLI